MSGRGIRDNDVGRVEHVVPSQWLSFCLSFLFIIVLFCKTPIFPFIFSPFGSFRSSSIPSPSHLIYISLLSLYSFSFLSYSLLPHNSHAFFSPTTLCEMSSGEYFKYYDLIFSKTWEEFPLAYCILLLIAWYMYVRRTIRSGCEINVDKCHFFL
jgi:hypothetical protein